MEVCFACLLSIHPLTQNSIATGLQKLLFLELRENHLKSVPYCLHSLPKLKELHIDEGVLHDEDI
jgi:hypothetical protein